ncbi:MAG: helix-turn-helix domain-containing protein [Bifidobacteriaceae bacterium]|nr:helix-turn-helix domain-containing protein [Bifidobacteriaceae bacterium]
MNPRKAAPPASLFATNVAAALHALLTDRGISDAEIARRIGRSQNYVSSRFRGDGSFTLSDVDAIARDLGIDAGSFLAGVSRRLGI